MEFAAKNWRRIKKSLETFLAARKTWRHKFKSQKQDAEMRISNFFSTQKIRPPQTFGSQGQFKGGKVLYQSWFCCSWMTENRILYSLTLTGLKTSINLRNSGKGHGSRGCEFEKRLFLKKAWRLQEYNPGSLSHKSNW